MQKTCKMIYTKNVSKNINLRYEYYPCFYCHSYEAKSQFRVNSYDLVVCANCGITYTRLPKTHNFGGFNDEHYSSEYLHNYEARKAKLGSRFRDRVREIEEYKNGGSILDVGCSTGMFLDVMKENAKYKWEYYGVDINKRSIAFAKKHTKQCSFNIGTVISLAQRKKQFDVVTCFDVLEHDPELAKTLKSIYKLLKPGGLLVVQSPNYKSIMAYLCGDNWDWWSLPDHIIHFTYESYTNLIMKSKFRILSSRTWDDKDDFILNTRGTIKLLITDSFMLNRILAKLSPYFLNIMYKLIKNTQEKLHLGGSIIIFSKKL